jgi:DNA-binding MarR family transcriptional regulator
MSDTNLTALHDVSASDVGKQLDRLPLVTADEDLQHAVTSLLRNRALHLIRKGSRSDLNEESLMLNRFLYSRKGKALRQEMPEFCARQDAVADLIAEAARRSDTESVDAILRSHKTHGMRLLELLARHEPEPVQRSVIRAELGLSESHLSHVLADFEEADVVVRRRTEGKEILVALGPAGREIVTSTLAPAWVEALIDVIAALVRGDVHEDWEDFSLDIEQKLRRKGLPSTLIVDRLKPLFDAAATRTPKQHASVATVA